MKKQNAGFTLIEVVVGITLIGIALGMVSAARQKRERASEQLQTSIEQAAQEQSKLEEPTTDVKKEPRKDIPQVGIPATGESKEKRPETSSHNSAPEGQKGPRTSDITPDKDSPVPFQQSDLCFPGSPIPLCAIPGFSEYWYEQQRQQEEAAVYYQQQQEAQQQLYEQYYYYEQQQQQMFDPNQFMQDPYQQYNPVLQDFYQQMLPGVYQQLFPGQ